MKSLILTFLFLTTSAFAQDICSFQETWEFKEALTAKGIKPTKKSTNHKRFTFIEKDMIHLTVTLQGWLNGVSREEALDNFNDMYEGQSGSLAGEIVYYTINGKKYALVHYWPGENEYGGFFEVKDRSYKLIAEISDSFIECR